MTGLSPVTASARFRSSNIAREPTTIACRQSPLTIAGWGSTFVSKPVSTPMRETLPPGRVALNDCSIVPRPPISTTWSTPVPPVSATARSGQSGVVT